MVFSKAFALAAVFATLASAAPMQQKRDYVYETVTQTDVTVVDTTITIYPGDPTPTLGSGVVAAATTTAAATSSVEVASSSSSSSSSSTSIYVPAPAATSQSSSSSSTSEAAPATTAAPTTAAVAEAAPTTSSSSTSSTSPSSTSSAATSSSTGSSILSGTGDGTYYDTATSMSAPSYCDTANDGDTTNVVALSQDVMEKSLCGATVTVEYEGTTVTGTVVDKCMGCDSDAIDMSQHMFESIADLSAGRITVSWSVE